MEFKSFMRHLLRLVKPQTRFIQELKGAILMVDVHLLALSKLFHYFKTSS